MLPTDLVPGLLEGTTHGVFLRRDWLQYCRVSAEEEWSVCRGDFYGPELPGMGGT